MPWIRLIVLGLCLVTTRLYAEQVIDNEVISDEDAEVIKNMAMLKEMKMINDANYDIVQQDETTQKEAYDY